MNNEKKASFIKFGMYILSLWLLFVLVFVNKVFVEICFECKFASAAELKSILINNWLPIICVLLLLISVLFYIYFVHLINGAKEGPYILNDVENKNSEHLVFLATYVIPLVGFGLETVRQIINLLITLTILGLIYVRTNLFYANPTLSLLGFKVYGAKMDMGGDRDSGAVILISKEELESKDSVNVLELDKRIFFVKKSIRVS